MAARVTQVAVEVLVTPDSRRLRATQVGVEVLVVETAPPAGSLTQRWDGSAWQPTTVKRWDGGAWVPATVKRWTGTQWV